MSEKGYKIQGSSGFRVWVYENELLPGIMWLLTAMTCVGEEDQ